MADCAGDTDGRCAISAAVSSARRLRRGAGRAVWRRWRADYRTGAGVQLCRPGLCPGSTDPSGGRYLAGHHHLHLDQCRARTPAQGRGALGTGALDDRWHFAWCRGWCANRRRHSGPHAAENHRCVRPGDCRADGPGAETQSRRRCAGPARPERRGCGDWLGLGDFRDRWWFPERAVFNLAQRAHAAGGGHLVGLRFAHRRRQCPEFYPGGLG